MDYEKAYKELVGKIKNALLYALTDSTKNVFENILSELAESEDEKIRKMLIRYFESCGNLEWYDGLTPQKAIAWLKKQGEQKASYTTLVETGDGGINALVTKELHTDGEQKPVEWSDEDDEHVNSLLERLEGLCGKEFQRTRFAVSEDEDWLKSLKQRIQKGGLYDR